MPARRFASAFRLTRTPVFVCLPNTVSSYGPGASRSSPTAYHTSSSSGKCSIRNQGGEGHAYIHHRLGYKTSHSSSKKCQISLLSGRFSPVAIIISCAQPQATNYPAQLQRLLDLAAPTAGKYCVKNLGLGKASMQKPPRSDASWWNTYVRTNHAKNGTSAWNLPVPSTNILG